MKSTLSISLVFSAYTAASALSVSHVESMKQFLSGSGNPFTAPMVDLGLIMPDAVSADNTPVVLMHGLGDAGDNPGMQSLAKSVTVRSATVSMLRKVFLDVCNR